jgi:ABC-type taurine transport system substrate-binding protein
MKADWCNIKISVPFRSTDHFYKLFGWLKENVDNRDYDFVGMDYEREDNRIIYFAQEKDAVLFVLRWI